MLDWEPYKQRERLRRTVDPLAVSIWLSGSEFIVDFLKTVDEYRASGKVSNCDKDAAVYLKNTVLPLIHQVTNQPNEVLKALEELSSILLCGRNNIPYNPPRVIVYAA